MHRRTDRTFMELSLRAEKVSGARGDAGPTRSIHADRVHFVQMGRCRRRSRPVLLGRGISAEAHSRRGALGGGPSVIAYRVRVALNGGMNEVAAMTARFRTP